MIKSAEIQRPYPLGHGGRQRFLMGFTRYGRGKHLGHVASIMTPIFHSLVPESFHAKIKFRSEQKVLRKSGLYFCMLRPRLRNELDLQYSHIFIKLDVYS